ncbi:MAG: ABC transporter permease [Candidatus Woesearchaeota archaeon]
MKSFLKFIFSLGVTITRNIPLQFKGFLYKDAILFVKRKKYFYGTLIFPILLGLIYIMILSSNTSVNMIVCDFDNSQITNDAFLNLPNFEVDIISDSDCVEIMKGKIKDNSILFGVLIEEGFSERLEALQTAELHVYYDNSNPSIASLAQWKIDNALIPFKAELVANFARELSQKSKDARMHTTLALQIIENTDIRTSGISSPLEKADQDLETLEKLDPHFVVSPIVTRQHGAYDEYSIVEVGIAPLVVILCMFIILMLCSTGVMIDKKTGIIKRIKASNASITIYAFAKIAYFTLISAIQFFIVLILFILAGASFSFSFPLIIKAIVYIALINSLIGMIIGFISDSEGVAVLMSLMFSLPMLLLSGMFYPVQIMPRIMQGIVYMLPLERQINMIKNALLFGGEIAFPIVLVSILVIWLAYLIRNN